MLYVYHGEDIDSARAKVRATVTSMLSKNPDALYFRVTSDSLSGYNFDELTGSQALFKSEYIVVLDTLFGNKEGEEIVLDNLEKIKESKHPFFLLESKLTAPIKKKLEKSADKIYEFKGTVKKEERFNPFSLTDALGERNKKKLWTLFREAKQNGSSDEEIHGIMFWMLKSIALARGSKNAEESGMKAYPFQKAQKFLNNYEDLDEILTKLALLVQTTRIKGRSLEIELEKFILKTL
ncbi:hypothetical protein COB52_00660 [Candidatus Kaiserbacteria bacterium]|nr:MAG: hypothetical protein COB52_00660 [Candidatus Kaiserbacteria bacterium]